jgi:hypothetical protein
MLPSVSGFCEAFACSQSTVPTNTKKQNPIAREKTRAHVVHKSETKNQTRVANFIPRWSFLDSGTSTACSLSVSALLSDPISTRDIGDRWAK